MAPRMPPTSGSADASRRGPLRAGRAALELGLVVCGLAVTGRGLLDTDFVFEWTDTALARFDDARRTLLVGGAILAGAAVLAHRRIGLRRAVLIPLPAVACAVLAYALPRQGYGLYAYFPLAIVSLAAVAPGGGEKPWVRER
jgi:peptidoglycan/LPS O-acetylase OafA/YrhL